LHYIVSKRQNWRIFNVLHLLSSLWILRALTNSIVSFSSLNICFSILQTTYGNDAGKERQKNMFKPTDTEAYQAAQKLLNLISGVSTQTYVWIKLFAFLESQSTPVTSFVCSQDAKQLRLFLSIFWSFATHKKFIFYRKTTLLSTKKPAIRASTPQQQLLKWNFPNRWRLCSVESITLTKRRGWCKSTTWIRVRCYASWISRASVF